MISGEFRGRGRRIVPYLTCDFDFPVVPGIGRKTIDLMVDTGADRTTLSRSTAEAIGLNLATLPDGGTSSGVGGISALRQVRSRLSVQGYSTTLWLAIHESRFTAPSLLGRDFMADFALFMEERTRRVLFLDPDDVARLGLAAPHSDSVTMPC